MLEGLFGKSIIKIYYENTKNFHCFYHHIFFQKNAYSYIDPGAGAAYIQALIDVTNPSPGLGWSNNEITPFIDRGPADCLMALALVHHLCIANNVPLFRVAELFSRLTSKYLIVEFVPKDDSQAQRLLRTREDIYTGFTQDAFEQSFLAYFAIESCHSLPGSLRTIYFMSKLS